MIIEKTGYEEHLRKTQQDFDSRWENVQELVSHPTGQALVNSRYPTVWLSRKSKKERSTVRYPKNLLSPRHRPRWRQLSINPSRRRKRRSILCSDGQVPATPPRPRGWMRTTITTRNHARGGGRMERMELMEVGTGMGRSKRSLSSLWTVMMIWMERRRRRREPEAARRQASHHYLMKMIRRLS